MERQERGKFLKGHLETQGHKKSIKRWSLWQRLVLWLRWLNPKEKVCPRRKQLLLQRNRVNKRISGRHHVWEVTSMRACFVCFVCCVCCTVLHAQSTSNSLPEGTTQHKGKSTWGVKLGSTASYTYLNDPFKTIVFRNAYAINPQLGAQYSYYIKPHQALQIEVLWSPKTNKQIFFQSSAQLTEVFQQIEIPVTAMLVKELKYFNFFITAGVYYQYTLSRTYQLQGELVFPLVDERLWDLPADRYNDHNYGVKGGGGIGRDFSWGKLQLAFSFGITLSNYISTDRLYQTEPQEAKLAAFSLGLVYATAFKKRK